MPQVKRDDNCRFWTTGESVFSSGIEGGCIILPNRALTEADLKEISGQQPGLVALIDSSADYPHYGKNPGEFLEEILGKVLPYDFETGNSADLKDKIGLLFAEEKKILFVPGAVTCQRGANFQVPVATQKLILDTRANVIPLFIEKLSEVNLRIGHSGGTSIAYGKLLEGETTTPAGYHEELLIAAERAFNNHAILEGNLTRSIILGLKESGSNTMVHDGNDSSSLRFDKLFAAAAALSRLICRKSNRKRIGIVLPPGKGGLVANLAVLLAGKVPVNLNFTAGSDAINSSMEQAQIDHLISASAFVDKVSSFPWFPQDKMILLDEVLPPLKPKSIFWLICFKLFSAKKLAAILEIPDEGGDDEAVLLFTSGSSGAPKGVILSHRNVLANVSQFASRLELDHEDKILGCLPLFHSFGSTVTLWYPMLEGIDLVTFPSPLEPPKLAKLIHQHGVTMLLATPTFLRGYMRRVEPEQLASIKYVITGAEKLPRKLAEAFENKFGKKVMEGYGLTETSPVANANIPNPEQATQWPLIHSERAGSVGQLLPGIAVRITNPDDDSPLPVDQSGMIWLRGANIFTGYLDLPEKTAEMLYDGWLRTGDIGRLDDEGFLYIEGRLSRFSKIGGEMVPHETVEAHINKALGLDSAAEKKITIIGLPDEAKGEVLILLTALEMDDAALGELRQKLLAAGIPALWIPKKTVSVEEIPALASGKLDIKRCEQLARTGASA
ncbi:MAG: AMP-binding protein [Verrucomicrobiaceae bacterium]|nr:AMP-binding protein [Verrucomicrobiaceae bacterium]